MQLTQNWKFFGFNTFDKFLRSIKIDTGKACTYLQSHNKYQLGMLRLPDLNKLNVYVHNLYYTVHQDDYPNPINFVNTNIKKNINSPLQLHIMNNITINSIVGDSRGTGAVKLKSGNSINFKPGFKTRPKSFFSCIYKSNRL